MKDAGEGQAKLNAVNAGEAARHDLVQGMISIKGVSALLLFDSGCLHSFMSYSLMCKLNLKTRTLEPPLIVNVPSGEKTLVDKTSRSGSDACTRKMYGLGLRVVSFGRNCCNPRDGLVGEVSGYHRL